MVIYNFSCKGSDALFCESVNKVMESSSIKRKRLSKTGDMCQGSPWVFAREGMRYWESIMRSLNCVEDPKMLEMLELWVLSTKETWMQKVEPAQERCILQATKLEGQRHLYGHLIWNYKTGVCLAGFSLALIQHFLTMPLFFCAIECWNYIICFDFTEGYN